jgi:hypothetical protein
MARQQNISLADLVQERWIMTPIGSSGAEALVGAFWDENLSPAEFSMSTFSVFFVTCSHRVAGTTHTDARLSYERYAAVDTRVLLGAAIVGLFVVVGVAVVYYFEGSCRVFDCIEQVPYNNAPFALILLAILVELLEKLWSRLKRRPSWSADRPE